MKILVDAIPMTGLLTGIARYLRNLYHAVDHLDLADTAYFTGGHPHAGLPPMADTGRWQQVTRSARFTWEKTAGKTLDIFRRVT